MRQRDPAFVNAWRHKPPEKQRPDGVRRSKWFQPGNFAFDAEAFTGVCPNGLSLKCSTRLAAIKGCTGLIIEGTREQCGPCPLRALCLRKPDVSPYRQVPFLQRTAETHSHAAVMKRTIDGADGRDRYLRRMATVELVYGNLHNHGLRRFTLRGKDKVGAQWKLFCLVHKLQKLLPTISRRVARRQSTENA